MARTKHTPRKHDPSQTGIKPEPGQPVKRKRAFKKWRAGTVALREITAQQKNTKYAIPGASFRRLVAEIVQKTAITEGMRVKSEVYPMLQSASEDFLIDVFKDGQAIAIENGHITLSRRDVKRAAKYQKEIYNRIVATSN